jgi:hypothetical protein
MRLPVGEPLSCGTAHGRFRSCDIIDAERHAVIATGQTLDGRLDFN